MRRLDYLATQLTIDNFQPEELAPRLTAHTDAYTLISNLIPTQSQPCHWGDLRDKSPIEIGQMFRSKESIPLALELGCGMTTRRKVSFRNKFGMAQHIIGSDKIKIQHPPNADMPHSRSQVAGYVQIDLSQPEQINVGGLQFHWISAVNVFHLDANNFPDPNGRFGLYLAGEAAKITLKKAFEMLLPGGILYLEPYHFGNLNLPEFVNQQGLSFHNISRKTLLLQMEDSCIIQKPL